MKVSNELKERELSKNSFGGGFWEGYQTALGIKGPIEQNKGRERMQIKMLQIKEAKGERITNPSQIAKLMKEDAKADREAFWVLHLNSQKQIIEKELVALGILNASIIHPREVFRKAILNSSDSIITVHNHPSGNIDISRKDKMTWQQLREAGKVLGIKVIDNFIITPQGKYYSEKEGVKK